MTTTDIQEPSTPYFTFSSASPSRSPSLIKQPIDLLKNMSSPKEVRWGILATGGIAQTLYVTLFFQELDIVEV